jgi:type IV pilus assembly protein PilC
MKYLDSKHQIIDDSEIEAKAVQNEQATPQHESGPHYTSFKLYVHQPAHHKKSVEPGAKVVKTERTLTGEKREDIELVTKLGRKRRFVLGRVSLTDKIMFMDNLSTMLKAGLSLAPALNTLAKETKNKYFAGIIKRLYQFVENGQLVSTGLKDYPKIFSEMIVATIEVGESTGMMADTMGHLANILKAQKKLQSKITAALMYPCIVLVAIIGVSLFLALFVFPQMVSIFEGSGVKIPIILRVVQFLDKNVRIYGWYMLGGLVLLILLIRFIFKYPKPKLWFDTLILKMPFVGNIIKEISLTRFTGNLHALLLAGLAIIRSLEIVAKTVDNRLYRQVILEMATELEKGVALSKAMSLRPHLFTSISIQLCSVGETTGELENILLKISNFYEERVNNVMSNLSVIIEPVLLILVGLAVGFIAVSVIGPIYEMTSKFA